MRIGLLGGTFDPPHSGHMSIAKAALEQLELDEVLFLPANKNPFKVHASQTKPRNRFEMVQKMIANEPAMAVSDMELTRGGVSYTVDTLGELQMIRPAEYWFVLGADAAKDLAKWKSPERLSRLCRIAVAIRPPETEDGLVTKIPEDFLGKLDMIRMKPQTISSSELRDRLAQGANVAAWLAPDVIKYIRENRLYRG